MAATATAAPSLIPSSNTHLAFSSNMSSPVPSISAGSRVSTPPPPPSKAVPTDFRSSLSAWWNNSSYRDARIAEERLLRRLSHFEPQAPAVPASSKGWFGGSSSSTEKTSALASAALSAEINASKEQVVPLVPVAGRNGLIATLRNVFVPTPDPAQAPHHPEDVHNPDSASPTSSSSSVNLHGKKHHLHLHRHKKHAEDQLTDYINTLEISTKENAESKEAVVVLHGYAAAFGFFFRNWDPIAKAGNETGRRTFFLYWLGMGLSSRPSPSLLNSPSSASVPARVARAEHFFLSSLESWRQSVGVDKMVLVGHSLGGYLAAAYTVRYPDRVSSLVLVSPAGIPRGPDYKPHPPNAPGESARDQEIDAVEMEMNQSQYEAKGEAKKWEESRENSLMRRNLMKAFVWGWEKGWSPFSLLRGMGPWAPMFAKGWSPFSLLRGMGPWAPMFAGRYSLRRFAAQSDEDIRDLHQYIYNTSILKGSGEFCISHILAPGAYARIPIVDRINKVKVPVTFLYGDNDWMDVDGGHASKAALKAAGNLNCSVEVIPKAGHHLYLDNPEVSNRVLAEAIRAAPTPQ